MPSAVAFCTGVHCAPLFAAVVRQTIGSGAGVGPKDGLFDRSRQTVGSGAGGLSFMCASVLQWSQCGSSVDCDVLIERKEQQLVCLHCSFCTGVYGAPLFAAVVRQSFCSGAGVGPQGWGLSFVRACFFNLHVSFNLHVTFNLNVSHRFQLIF